MTAPSQAKYKKIDRQYRWQLTCSPELVRETLSRAVLPLTWKGKGVVGLFESNDFRLNYRGTFLNNPFGPRLAGTIEANGNGSRIQARFVFHSTQWLLIIWVTWFFVFLSSSFLFTTPLPAPFNMSSLFLFLISLTAIGLESKMASDKLLEFIDKTTAEWHDLSSDFE